MASYRPGHVSGAASRVNLRGLYNNTTSSPQKTQKRFVTSSPLNRPSTGQTPQMGLRSPTSAWGQNSNSQKFLTKFSGNYSHVADLSKLKRSVNQLKVPKEQIREKPTVVQVRQHYEQPVISQIDIMQTPPKSLLATTKVIEIANEKDKSQTLPGGTVTSFSNLKTDQNFYQYPQSSSRTDIQHAQQSPNMRYEELIEPSEFAQQPTSYNPGPYEPSEDAIQQDFDEIWRMFNAFADEMERGLEAITERVDVNDERLDEAAQKLRFITNAKRGQPKHRKAALTYSPQKLVSPKSVQSQSLQMSNAFSQTKLGLNIPSGSPVMTQTYKINQQSFTGQTAGDVMEAAETQTQPMNLINQKSQGLASSFYEVGTQSALENYEHQGTQAFSSSLKNRGTQSAMTNVASQEIQAVSPHARTQTISIPVGIDVGINSAQARAVQTVKPEMSSHSTNVQTWKSRSKSTQMQHNTSPRVNYADQSKSYDSVPDKMGDLWSRILSDISKQRFSQAYQKLLGSGDDLYLLRLMHRTGV